MIKKTFLFDYFYLACIEAMDIRFQHFYASIFLFPKWSFQYKAQNSSSCIENAPIDPARFWTLLLVSKLSLLQPFTHSSKKY